ncbi:MAG: alpha/beta hydrolase family protein [Planctomycetota bacterium]
MRALAKRMAGLAIVAVALAATGDGRAAETAPAADAAEEAWKVIAPYFAPPKGYENDFGPHKPVMKFYDGKPVKTAEDWKRRREEIRAKWHEMMGPWPPLIEKPKVEYLSKEEKGTYTQHTVKVNLAPDQDPWTCYLLVPGGDGPFPAAVTVYYYPEGPLVHKKSGYARELAKRGFVVLAIGRADYDGIAKGWKSMAKRMPDHQKGTHCYWPSREKPQLAPLSFMAYAAANAYNALATLKQVDARRVGIVGHSYGGKWSMFGACLYEKFACGVWSDPGVTIFNPRHGGANYWSRGYLGATLSGSGKSAYRQIKDGGHDLHELQALMAPRPFLVSGVQGGPDPKEEHTDQPIRWQALNHVVAANKLLGYEKRVAMTNDRPEHYSTRKAQAQVMAFFEYFLKHGKALEGAAGNAK